MVDLGLDLVRDTLRADRRVGGRASDLNLAQSVLERLLDLRSTDQQSHVILAGAVFELLVALGKVLQFQMKISLASWNTATMT